MAKAEKLTLSARLTLADGDKPPAVTHAHAAIRKAGNLLAASDTISNAVRHAVDRPIDQQNLHRKTHKSDSRTTGTPTVSDSSYTRTLRNHRQIPVQVCT